MAFNRSAANEMSKIKRIAFSAFVGLAKKAKPSAIPAVVNDIRKIISSDKRIRSIT